MLTPKELEHIDENVAEVYEQIENDIISCMAQQIVNADFSAGEQMWREAANERMSRMRGDILLQFSKRSAERDQQLISLFNKAAKKSFERDEEIYREAGRSITPLIENEPVQKILNSGFEKTDRVLKNISETTARTAPIQMEKVLENEYWKVQSGTIDSNTAVRNAIKELAQKGVACSKSSSGRTEYLSAGVHRGAVTGVSQGIGKMQEQLADEAGCDLVETSAHSGARPEHAKWQGRIFSRSGESNKYPDFVSSTGYGTGAGLKGWNCRHDFSPYFEGMPPKYTEESLKALDEVRVEYNGQKISEYEATQKQRNLERKIKDSKRELAGYDAGIKAADSESLKEELQGALKKRATVLENQKAALQDFKRQTGFGGYPDFENEAVFDEPMSQKAMHQAEEQYQQWIKEIGASGSAPKTLAEYYKNKYNNTWEHQLLLGYGKAVQKGDISPLIGFDQYIETAKRANSDLIGLTTSNGHTVETYTTHFIDRVIGQVAEPHSGKRLGVPIEKVKECLLKPESISDVYERLFIDNNGNVVMDKRIDFMGKDCSAAYSVSDEKIIQVNPRRK